MKTKQTPPSQFIQRKKLLKDAYQKRVTGTEDFRSTITSPRDVRKSIAQLFKSPSLIPLTQEEKGVLKEQAKTYLMQRLTHDHTTLNEILKGNERIDNPQGEKRLHVAFSKPNVYEASETIRGYSLRKVIPPFNLRTLDQYDIDVKTLIAHNMNVNPHYPIRILDIGAGNNKMLAEIKNKLGDLIETHALTIDDLPKYHADYNHLAMAEHMPAHFAGKFNIITSNWQIEYSVLPHLMLRNIAHALAINGQAAIHLNDETLSNLITLQEDISPKTLNYYKKASNEEKTRASKMPKDPLAFEEINKLQNLRIVKIQNELERLKQTGKFQIKNEHGTIKINRIA